MIPPESSGASRTKVAWCNLGVRAVEVARTAGCWSVVRRFARPRRGASPARRLFPLPPRPAPPPTSHDTPPAPPRAVTSRRPDPDQPTACDHSTHHERHVLTTHGPPKSHQLPLVAPPGDSSRDLGETHAARRATSPAQPGGPPRVRRAPSAPPTGHDSPLALPRAVMSRRPDPGQPTPCDHSKLHTRHVLTTHGPPRSHQPPLAAPPGDSSYDLDEAHAARRATSPPPPGGPPRPRRALSPRRPVTTHRPPHPARSRPVGRTPANRRPATTRGPTDGTS